MKNATISFLSTWNKNDKKTIVPFTKTFNWALTISGWIAAHAVVGFAWKVSPLVANLHGASTTVVALTVAFLGGPAAVTGTVLYVAASEVAWRMSNAALPHMLGAYLAIIVAGTAALRRRILPPLAGWFYLLPLLPSGWLTFEAVRDLELVRQLLAFGLAGPVALFTVLWYCKGVRVTPNIWRIVVFCSGPIVITSCAILSNIATVEEIHFTTESNFAMSAGYGPNQIASVLSWGLLLSLGYVWLGSKQRMKPMVWLVILFLTLQTLLTFSRSGVAMVLGAMVGMGLILLRRSRLRGIVTVTVLIIWVIAQWAIVPALNEVTKGAFVERYKNPDLSGREAIAKSDLDLFVENPIFGVGPGMGSEYRLALIRKKASAHTEFTRVLAEHGIFGAISLVSLIILTVKSIKRANNTPRRAWVFGMFTWAWLYFSVNAFRTVLPAAAIMLALLVLAGQTRPRLQTQLSGSLAPGNGVSK